MDETTPQKVNPYAPPATDVDFGLRGEDDAALASRGSRWAAAMLDGLLALVVVLPALVKGIEDGLFSDGSTLALYRAFGASAAGGVSGVAWLGLIALQAYLIARTGQSLAKRWLKIRIVKLDGKPVGFVSGVVVRTWALMVIGHIPLLNGIIPLVDALFIFRADRRCIHDHLAGTKVISAR